MEPNPGGTFYFHIHFLRGGIMIPNKKGKPLSSMEDSKSFNWSIQEETLNEGQSNTRMVLGCGSALAPQPQSGVIQRPLPYGCGSC